MPEPRGLSPVAAIGIWLTAVVGFGLLAVTALGAIYADFLNCDDPAVDSAMSSTRWLFVAGSVLLPLAVLGAIADAKDRRLLLVVAVVVAAIELWVWWLLLNPTC